MAKLRFSSIKNRAYFFSKSPVIIFFRFKTDLAPFKTKVQPELLFE